MYRIFMMSLLLIGMLSAQTTNLTLDDCIGMAMENNPDLRLSKKQVEAAIQDVTGSYSTILPNAGIGYENRNTSQGVKIQYYEGVPVDTLPESKSTTHGFGLQVNQNIYDGGRWWNTIKQAKNDLSGVQLTQDYTRQMIISSVTQRFYEVLKAQQLLTVYEKSLENSREQLKKTEEMLKIGQVAKKDLYKAQVREGNDRLNIIRQQTVLKNALAVLNQVMGRSPGELFAVSESEYKKPEIVEMETAVKNAFESNRELKTLETERFSAELQHKMAKSYWQPSLRGTYSYARGGNDLNIVYSDFDKWWSNTVTLNLSWTIFDGFQRRTSIQKSLIGYRMYDDRIDKKKIEISNQVQQLIENLNTYMNMLDIYDLNIQSAHEDLRLAQEMYRLNSATLLEVLDAQVAYTAAQADLINVKFDAKIAEVQLALLMGSL